MAEKLLSDRRCATVKIDAGETLLSDGGNLYLRVRPGGKDWLLIPRLNGKRIKIGLGGYPEIGLSEARTAAADMRKQVREGADPRQAKKSAVEEIDAQAQEKTAPETVLELFKSWHRFALLGRKDEGAGILRSFSKDVLPNIGDTLLCEVKRGNVTTLLDTVASRGVTRTCGVLLADLRQMFSFAVDREYMATNPTSGLKKTSWNGASQERDRVLSNDEIKLLVEKLPATLQKSSVHACWIMLSTLCRIGEISKAKWQLIDFDKATWTIPKEDTKNKKEHLINLSPFAIEQFKQLQVLSGDSVYVLPARNSKSSRGHVCEKALSKQIGDRQDIEGMPMSNRTKASLALVLPGGRWRPHDLRRTGATIMGSLGIRPDVIEKCLNHVEKNKMMRIYQRQELRPEMKDAWLRLGGYIDKLTASH